MEFKIEINDALASQIVRETADVAIEMSKSFSTQGFLTTVGNIVKPIIQNVFQAENTSSVMPMLLGMIMNGSLSKTDSPAAAKDNPEKPEPTQTGVAMPAQPTQTQE
jgi:hypothetical protein